MTERIITLDEEPARLSVRNHLLVMQLTEGETTVPLAEIGVLVIFNPCVVLTHAALSELAQAGALLVVCDSRRMPAAMLLPLEGYFIQAEQFARQAQAPLPLRKRLWQSVVKAKIRAQARLLEELLGNDAGLTRLAQQVRSGDTGNLEAEAARRYWPLVFSNPDFRRLRYGPDQNRLLNYGYGVRGG
jgi:CRISP-associated protein Cas1